MSFLASVRPLPLAASLPDFPALSDSIIYQINGLIVVFTALGLLWGLLELMSLWFKRRARPAVPAPAPSLSVQSSLPDDLSPELVAAMAAAVHSTLSGSARITSIVRVDTPDHEWTREGRRQIHSARKVR
jgi:Na+-transporting methylmalonyl-CoA/oxaloacetate decarboxylase gamma subunit